MAAEAPSRPAPAPAATGQRVLAAVAMLLIVPTAFFYGVGGAYLPNVQQTAWTPGGKGERLLVHHASAGSGWVVHLLVLGLLIAVSGLPLQRRTAWLQVVAGVILPLAAWAGFRFLMSPFDPQARCVVRQCWPLTLQSLTIVLPLIVTGAVMVLTGATARLLPPLVRVLAPPAVLVLALAVHRWWWVHTMLPVLSQPPR